MGKRQFTRPLLIRGDKATPLEPISQEHSYESEEQLQELLFSYPSLIPIEEIEPGFGNLIPVARELGTDRGSIDHLFIDKLGHLVLVETKLWRNPEARRQVVAQLVDYASDLATWSYNDLIEAIKKATGSKENDLLVTLAQKEDPSEFNESRFIDAVTRNLSLGRFLLLIIGDGIHEGVEQMAEFLQNQPQLGFHLALIEMTRFKVDDNSDNVFIQPRIVAKTREIIRAVVEVRIPAKPSDIVVKPPEETTDKKTKSESLSQKEYFEQLGKVSPELRQLVDTLLTEASKHSLRVEWKPNGPILKYWFETKDGEDFVNFGQLAPDGTLAYSNWLSGKCCDKERLSLSSDFCNEYYKTVVGLLGTGTRTEKHREGVRIAGQDGNDPLALPLLRMRKEWFRAIDTMIEKLQMALDERK